LYINKVYEELEPVETKDSVSDFIEFFMAVAISEPFFSFSLVVSDSTLFSETAVSSLSEFSVSMLCEESSSSLLFSVVSSTTFSFSSVTSEFSATSSNDVELLLAEFVLFAYISYLNNFVCLKNMNLGLIDPFFNGGF
jgi:hypothetical protein